MEFSQIETLVRFYTEVLDENYHWTRPYKGREKDWDLAWACYYAARVAVSKGQHKYHAYFKRCMEDHAKLAGII